MLLPQEVIRTKRNGGVLTNEEIHAFVNGLVDHSFSDAQVGAMAMAIFSQGMQASEIVTFTDAMKHSGTVLSWPDIDGPIVDKHSTGGVGDKVSFMLTAIVAACGAYVPMISGRGLGHTGGTSDKLESIAGVNIEPSIADFQAMVKELGVAIITQTKDLAPADKRLYGIRDVTATVESIPLITASILSKKLAAGLDALIMDVKVGNGAMMNNLADAQALAESIVTVANGSGVKTQAIITDMNQVLGNTAGNALEMIETAKYLAGVQQEPRLDAVVRKQAVAMLMSAGVHHDEDKAEKAVANALSSGKAAELFNKMIAALGGPNDFMEDPWKCMNKANIIVDVLAPEHGYISGMQTRDIGLSVVALGGGRTAPGQDVDHTVGFDRILPIGTKVNRGDVLARVHARSEDDAKRAAQQYVDAHQFAEQPVEDSPVIYQTIC